MKIILVLATLFGIMLQAQADILEYSCPQELEYSPLKLGAYTKKVVEVYSANNSRYKVLKIYDEVLTTKRRSLVHEALVSVSTEDVMFDMRGRDLFMRIYLDELNESYITIGRQQIHIDCVPQKRRR
jgi:hypothetical protein